MNQKVSMDTPEKTCMSEQEFITHINELIPNPSVETNNELLDFANEFWIEMKDDLYHAFSFVSHHFTKETLQNVYDLFGTQKSGMMPREIIGLAIYLQAGTPPENISKDEWGDFVFMPMPETADTISPLAICTVWENGQEIPFYTLHFGQMDPQKLLDTAIARAGESDATVTETLQKMDYNLPNVESYIEARKVIIGAGTGMLEKLSLLMNASPITAAHITMDVDSGSVILEMNPLWEKLRDERESGWPARQAVLPARQKRLSKQKNQMDR